MKVLVTGASGFVGGALIKYLLNSTDHEVVALTRSGFGIQHPRLENRLGDLFSLEQTYEALKGIDIAFYLIHSMLPTAGLDQGDFEDYDAILADNFQRAARDNHLKKIIYLGGLQPTLHVSSRHLNSRFEVESILARSQVPLVCFRAGMVLGAGGSSFTIMLRLVKRLPVMVCPGWTKTLTQPVDLDDLVVSLTKESLVLNHQEKNKVIDIGFPNSMTYLEMLKMTAEELNLKRYFLKVPFFSPGFSRLWVTLLTGAPKALVAPLVDSLKYPMILQSENKMTVGDFKTSLKKALMSPHQAVRAFRKNKTQKIKSVRSVQRLVIPLGMTAKQIGDEYFSWLPRFFSSFIQVNLKGDECVFYIPILNLKLLILRNVSYQSHENISQLKIVGGLLAKKNQKGWLEFREVIPGLVALSAIHDFTPALPWFIYRLTQAPFHLFVMNAFKKYLYKRKDEL